jgi:hypothetical protein
VQSYDNKKHSSEEDGGSEHAYDSHHLATLSGSSAVPEIRHRRVSTADWIHVQRNKRQIFALLGYYAASCGNFATRRRVISQKSADLINIAAEAYNQSALVKNGISDYKDGTV